MDGALHGAGPLAVDDAHLQYPLFPAEGEVIGHEVLHLAGIEGMEVENSVAEIQGVLVEIDVSSGKAIRIERVRQASAV